MHCQYWISLFFITLSGLLLTNCRNGHDNLSFTYQVEVTSSEKGSMDGELDLALQEMLESSQASWHLSNNMEMTEQRLTLLEMPMTLREVVHMESDIHQTFINFMGQNLKMERSLDEIQHHKKEMDDNFVYKEYKNDQKKILGFDCYRVSGGFRNLEPLVNFNCYICPKITMHASLFQGLEYNPFDGGILEMEVDMGSISLLYKAIDFQSGIPDGIWDFQEEYYIEIDRSEVYEDMIAPILGF